MTSFMIYKYLIAVKVELSMSFRGTLQMVEGNNPPFTALQGVSQSPHLKVLVQMVFFNDEKERFI